jgi:peptidylprolyl isomerase
MRGIHVRRVVAGIIAAMLMLLTAACGSSSDTGAKPTPGTISDVTVSGPSGQKPTVKFDAPVSFGSTQSTVVDKGPGKGPAVRPDSVVTVDYVAINASDADEFDSSWTGGKPATFGLDQVIKGLAIGLTGSHAGDRVLITVASKDGYDPVGNGTTVRKGDSLVFVVDVHAVSNPLKSATGIKQPPPPGIVPTLQYAKGVPTGFKATAETPKAPATLGVYPLIKGRGPAVKKGQTIVVNYLGQIYPDGTVFQETYSTDKPVPVQIGTGAVIPGWDTGLVGQTVGSRVELVVPAAEGYGGASQGTTIPANSDLIFVVDILQAY